MFIKIIVLSIAALFLANMTILGTAFFTDNAPPMIGTALLVLCSINFMGIHFLLKPRFAARTVTLQVVSTLVLVCIFYFAILMPARGKMVPDVTGIQYWELSTGSRIAYIKIEPKGPAHAVPILFVHGGPGVADLEGDAAYFGRLRDLGYSVYVYDQLGAGRSSRLQDPSEYTRERDVADLEEIRKQIGAEKIILIGHSYGASVAAAYIAKYGDHVEKLIVSSPGNLVNGLDGGGDLQSRLPLSRKLSLYALILQPRPLTVYTLLQINPRAAHNFAGDSEMDARFGDVYAITEPALYCGDRESTEPSYGVGFYANQFPQSAHGIQPKDITSMLRRYQIPTLVFKGSCDYLTWASAIDYLDALQSGPAQLVYLRDAGHNIYQDKPLEFESNLKAFLLGQPLPDEYTGIGVPADYEKGY